MNRFMQTTLATALAAAALTAAHADAVTDWNIKTGEFITESKLGTPPAVRVMALVQTAAASAVERAPAGGREAAVAAAHRATLASLLPGQLAAVEAAYRQALAQLADSPERAAGITAGERAAAAVLASRADEAALLAAPDSYRPFAQPGHYVPTALPAATAWQRRKPWLMNNPAQFRPAPPPALSSEAWARELEEVKVLGGRNNSKRTSEQTEIARFWEYSLPAIYHGVVRSVALAPGRELLANARLFASVAQAMDDAMISVFDAKYHYNFWRPVTAIRNADNDGNDATTRDASWAPFIDTPAHPEYPSAHSILAAAVGTVLQAELGQMGEGPVRLSTSSPTAKGATRQWSRVDDFVREVSVARIYDGVHYRFSTEVGTAMGRAIGQLAVAARGNAAP